MALVNKWEVKAKDIDKDEELTVQVTAKYYVTIVRDGKYIAVFVHKGNKKAPYNFAGFTNVSGVRVERGQIFLTFKSDKYWGSYLDLMNL
jgi:hypothetical protein